MKKFKYILTSILLALVCLFASGCGTTTLKTEINPNGEVRCTLVVSLDGLNNDQRNDLYELFVKYGESLNNAYKTKLATLYGNIYNYAELNLDTIEKQQKYVKLQNPKFLTDDKFTIEPAKQWALNNDFSSYDSFSIQMSYASIYAYVMFFCPKALEYDANQKDIVINKQVYTSLVDTPINVLNYEKQNSTFWTAYIETCAPFYYNQKEPYLVEDIAFSNGESYSSGTKLVDVACDLLGVSKEQANLMFNFSTPYRRLHTDGTQKEDGTYEWQLGSNISGNIKMWRFIANQTMWYLFALLAGIVVLCVGGIICAVVKYTRTQKGMNALKNIQSLENPNQKTPNQTNNPVNPTQKPTQINPNAVNNANKPTQNNSSSQNNTDKTAPNTTNPKQNTQNPAQNSEKKDSSSAK